VVRLYRTYADRRRTLAVGYVVLVVLAFAFSYPISERAFKLRLWLPSRR